MRKVKKKSKRVKRTLTMKDLNKLHSLILRINNSLYVDNGNWNKVLKTTKKGGSKLKIRKQK